MRKKLIFFILILCSIALSAYDLGGEFFPKDSDIYFVSRDYSYFEANPEFIEKTDKILLNYNDFNGIEMKELLNDGNYAMAFYDKLSSFVMIKEMNVGEYINSSFYNNPNFEKEVLENLNVNYSIGEKQFAFLYYNEKLYLSNNISLFFKTINALKIRIDGVGDEENYVKTASDEEYQYKLYGKTDEDKEIYGKRYKYYSEIRKENLIFRRYVLEESEEENKKTVEEKYNFSDYIVDSPDKIYIGRSFDFVQKVLEKDFELLSSYDFEKFRKSISENLKTVIYIEKDKKYYIILKGEKKWEGIEESFKELYEDNFMKGFNRFDLLKSDYGYKLKLPLSKIEKYIGVKKGEYFIIAENEEFLRDIKIGKYYNYEYSDISSSKEIYRDYINNEFGEYMIENGILSESISIENIK